MLNEFHFRTMSKLESKIGLQPLGKILPGHSRECEVIYVLDRNSRLAKAGTHGLVRKQSSRVFLSQETFFLGNRDNLVITNQRAGTIVI